MFAVCIPRYVGVEAALDLSQFGSLTEHKVGYAVVAFAIHERILSVLKIHLDEDHSRSLACSWPLEPRNITIVVSSLS